MVKWWWLGMCGGRKRSLRVRKRLARLIDQGGNGTERGTAMELHASLNELADRYAVPKRESVAIEAPPPSVH